MLSPKLLQLVVETLDDVAMLRLLLCHGPVVAA